MSDFPRSPDGLRFDTKADVAAWLGRRSEERAARIHTRYGEDPRTEEEKVMDDLKDVMAAEADVFVGCSSCCDYRDHEQGVCACPEHALSPLHPFGS